MSVYVDNMRARYGRMIMCHMVADTHEELIAMADKIGVDRRWIQKPGAVHEHFDVSLAKRALAVKAGAVEISMGDLGRIFAGKRLSLRPWTCEHGRTFEEGCRACGHVMVLV